MRNAEITDAMIEAGIKALTRFGYPRPPKKAISAAYTEMKLAEDEINKWLKKGEVKAGDTVQLDGGFTCVEAGPVVIEQDAPGLWFPCEGGGHYIDGQLNNDNEYVGLSAT